MDVEEYENEIMYPEFARWAEKAGRKDLAHLFRKVAGEEKLHAMWLRELYDDTRLGEWVTGLCYGPGVVGCLWLLTGQFVNASALLCMTAFAALAVALLLSHQPPQIESDRQAGKHSFAVRYGARQTCRVSRMLFGVFLLSYGLALWQSLQTTLTLAVFAAMAMLALYRALQSPLSPKRILLPASIVIVASLVASLVTIQATTVSSCASTCIRPAKTAFGRDARTTVITRCYRCQSITAVRRS